jgi:hypothetical protein
MWTKVGGAMGGVLGDTIAEEYTGTTGATDVARVLKSEFKMNKKIWKMKHKHATTGVNTGVNASQISHSALDIAPVNTGPRRAPQLVHAVGMDVAPTHPVAAPLPTMRNGGLLAPIHMNANRAARVIHHTHGKNSLDRYVIRGG